MSPLLTFDVQMPKQNMPRIRTRSKDPELVKTRRKQIIDGALRAFLKKGYDRTSIREIAQTCGMSIGALYHYVGSKEDILYLFIERGLSSALGLIEECKRDAKAPREALRDAIDRWFRIIDDIQDMTVFSYHEIGNLKGQARQRLFDIDQSVVAVFEELLSMGVKNGDFKVSDVKLQANTIVTIGHLWALRRWYFHKHYTLDKFIKEQTEFIIRGVS